MCVVRLEPLATAADVPTTRATSASRRSASAAADPTSPPAGDGPAERGRRRREVPAPPADDEPLPVRGSRLADDLVRRPMAGLEPVPLEEADSGVSTPC